jgi:hypothetical protein
LLVEKGTSLLTYLGKNLHLLIPATLTTSASE